MIRLFSSLMLAAVLCLGATAASADTKVHEASGLEVWLPDAWTLEAEGDMLAATTQDEGVAVIFMVLEAADVEAAIEALDAELGSVLSDVELTSEPTETQVNGLDAFVAEGKATVDGGSVEFGLALIASPTGKILLVLGFAESEAYAKHARELEKIMSSLKPAG